MKKMFFMIIALSFTGQLIFAQEGLLSTGKIPSMKIERTHTVVNQLDNQTNIAYGYSNLQNVTLSMPIPAGTPFSYLSNYYTVNFASSMCKGCNEYYLIDISRFLYSFDETTGYLNFLGSITGMGGDQPNGIAFNPADRKYYIVSSSNFYSLDIETRAATLIGPLNLTSGGLMIDLCFDLSGTCYAYEVDVSTASAYTINITTGNATAIGTLGYYPNYGQGMSYDFETNTIYLSAFNGGTNTGQLRTMNATTGMTTLITDWGYEQIAPFVISNSSLIMCPCWIGSPYNPDPPNGSTDITLYGTTLNWVNGVYTTSVEVWFGPQGDVTKVYDGSAITSWPTNYLNYETTYQWRVVCKNDTCSTWGPTWSFTTAQNPNVIYVYPQYINYWTGTCDSTNKTQVSLINANGSNFAGWMVYDVSTIPLNAIILDIEFNGFLYANNWPYWSVTPMGNVNPVITNAETIYNQVSNNYEDGVAYSFNQETGTLPNGWISRELGNGAASHLQTALQQGWFAIGIFDWDVGSSYFVRFQGWAENNIPYLRVTLDWCLSCVPPNSPANLNAQVIFNPSPQVQLNWQDNSWNESGFKIYRKFGYPNDPGNYFIIDTVFNNITQFIDVTVLPESTYTYRVFAYNQYGQNGSNTATIAVPVPVELISFTAEVYDNAVSLFWLTATETNNQGFEILRFAQIDNVGWERIGFVEGKGTTTEIQSYSFTDKPEPGQYKYRLKQIDFDGTFAYSSEVEAEVKAPMIFSLEQNYPNPFNPSTKIKYTVPFVETHRDASQLVSLKIYDILGNEVATLVNEEQAPGVYEVEFNSVGPSRDLSLPSGIYFYQLKAGSFIETKKMILLK